MTQHGSSYRIMQDYPTESLPRSIEKLCGIEVKKCLRIDVSHLTQTTTSSAIVKPVKKAAVDALFQNCCVAECFPADLLHNDGWTVGDIVSAVAFRLRRNQRRYYDADRLEKFSLQVMDANSENEQALKFLLCLSNIDNHRPRKHDRFQVPTSDEIKSVARRKCPITEGDFPFFVFNPSYTLPDFKKKTTADDVTMYPEINAWKQTDLLHATRYSNPELKLRKKGIGLFGFRSKFFSHQSLTNSSYEVDSQTRLYGGLRHSRTFDLDIKMSYPKLTGPIDLLASVSTPTDEGFVSPSSSFNFSDSELEEPAADAMQSVCVSYFDYKLPRRDLNLWKDCLTHKQHRHYTWETLGLPAGCTPRRLYLTEAGSKIFDEVWKKRCLLIHRLSDFYHDSTLSKVVWLEFDEKEFVKCAVLVVMGVPSKVFQFNALGQLYLPHQYVYFSGVDSAALRSLLLKFCRWGTCYHRLLKFSMLFAGQFDENLKMSALPNRGSVFKAFISALGLYLRGYLCKLLALKYEDISLLSLATRIEAAGDQIEYIARLCQCGNPGLPIPSTIPDKNFPTGVRLLSYLYEEVVHQPNSTHHLLLLFLLKRSCAPYLEFVKDWVFRGQCRDVHGEFMLKVNINYGARLDRQRWLKYVEPANPDDPGSCVPAFLVSIASDLYMCGKTVSLMQTVSSSHLLAVEGSDCPRLEIAFSKQKIQQAENEWSRHQIKMAAIETEQNIHWALVEERRKAEAHRAAIAARRAAHDGLLKMQEAVQLERRRVAEEKGREFERLKKQAEDDATKRSLARQTEMAEDIKREDERQRSEQILNSKKNKMILEEKEKIVSYYDELNKEADRRIRKANWSKRRNRLHHERIKFLAQDEKFWRDQTSENDGEKFTNRPVSELELALQSIGSEIQETSPFEFSPEKQQLVKLHRKGVHGSHVSQTSLDGDLEEVKLHRKGVHGSHVSQTSLDGDLEEVKLHRNGVHGSHVSQTTLNLDIETRSQRKTVDGQHISSTSDDAFLSPDPIGHLKKPVPGKNISASSVNLMDFSDDTDPSTERTLRKPVPGHSVSDSSIGNIFKHDSIAKNAPTGVVMPTDPSITELPRTLRKSVPGRGVSGSSIGNLLVDLSLSPHEACPKTFKKTIPGQNVSLSSVGDLMRSSPAPNIPNHSDITEGCVSTSSSCEISTHHSPVFAETVKASIKLVSGQNISNAAIGELLQPELKPSVQAEANEIHRKKKSTRNISTSSIQEGMSLEPGDRERLERFSYANRIHGKHHSQSTIENLVYYDGTMPWIENNIAAANPQMLKSSVNSSKRHPSFSTIQLVMYRESAEIVDDVADSPKEAFQLQLPCGHTYVEPRSQSLPFSDDMIGNSVDLMKNFPRMPDADEEDEFLAGEIESAHTQELPALLRRCIIFPISQQIELVNRCALNYFMTDLKLLRHFEMMRRFCFMEDGEFGEILSSGLFEKMRAGCKPSDLLNPVVLDSLILQAVQGSLQRNSEDSKRLTFSLTNVPDVFSSQQPESLDCFSLKYDIGWPHNIIITEANHAKYGQVFGFLLQLKRVMWSLNDVTKKLSLTSNRLRHLSSLEFRRLHLFRHEMHCFVQVMQGYVSTQVVHVSWHEFLQDLKKAKCLEDLHSCHVEYLRKCVFRCLLTKKTSMVMSVITDIFKTILRFWSQLFSKDVKFTDLNVTFANFKKYSNFLFKVVSKLVKLGYQPSLENFLLRLNFNGVYGE